MKLNPLQNDRAAGVLVAMAAGDALGAGYEFGAPLPDGAEVTMKGGGPFGFAPSEWTDDTSMAIPIAQALLESSSTAGSSSPAALTMIVRAWTAWASEAKDVGAQTSSVIAAARRLASAAGRSKVHAADFTAAAADFHSRTGRSAGNGSLMRTAPLALAYLDRDPASLMAEAAVLSALTHADPDAQEACGLWCVAIRKAVLTGELDSRAGLPLLPPERVALWLKRIETAERSRPRDFEHNGWVVEALQGVWSAIHFAGLSASGPAHLRAALEEVVRGGRDTDTVAAIAGGLLGAAHGYTAVPFEWRRNLHGWPGLHARDLMTLGMELARGEGRRQPSWPRAAHQDYSMWGRTDVLVQHRTTTACGWAGSDPLRGLPSSESTPWCRCAGLVWRTCRMSLPLITQRSGWLILLTSATTPSRTSCWGRPPPPSNFSGLRAKRCCCIVFGRSPGRRRWLLFMGLG
ncbi:ADP-ribosylglycohydrolase family protein [Arthrobacter ramosus]|uniref:ADP-ribosylglycohydrolase family protein n=1 Tax=Arthrobacter ramosus TaxID=1672 RepID=A0ABV5Y0N7_ARTRM|nr:ADP-ribosylglycohydrolase family protein [Arthrobacter ramosus]